MEIAVDLSHANLTLDSWEETRVERGMEASASEAGRVASAAPDRWCPDDDESEHPAYLGRYRLVRRIGQGAMGVVFEGHDAELDRRVALKVLRASAEAEGSLRARSRMMREARALARLRHPHVASIYGVDTTEDGILFIAMEMVNGQTLKRWLRSRWRSCGEIVQVFVQAGRGLAAAHAAGLVHRDFKPDNVIVDERGEARVVDFGLARTTGLAEVLPTIDDSGTRAAESPMSLTCTGAVLGTPAYMAPEQLDGGLVRPAGDQFSFCVALFEALYGRRPYPGTDLPSLQRSLVDGQMVGPRRGVPRRLYRVLRRGLCTEPSGRYPDMDTLLRALERCVSSSKARRSMMMVVGLGLAAAAGSMVPLRATEPTEPTEPTESTESTESAVIEAPDVASASVAPVPRALPPELARVADHT